MELGARVGMRDSENQSVTEKMGIIESGRKSVQRGERELTVRFVAAAASASSLCHLFSIDLQWIQIYKLQIQNKINLL